MWTRFLLFGISIIAIFSSCRKEYTMNSNWIYINETKYTISYHPDYYNSDFSLKPFDTVTYFVSGDGGKDITEKDYVSPLHNAYIIFFDNIRCDTLLLNDGLYFGDGPTGTVNYESKKLGDGYYEFTYRFTEEDFNNAKECK